MDARTDTPDTTVVGIMGVDVPPERRPLVMSPINRRRWQNFKANRRGYWAFWIFMVLFVVTLFAEFLANDKPFLVRVDGKTFVPVLFTYPETAFGGEFETAADYRDPYLRDLIAQKGGTMWPPPGPHHDQVNIPPLGLRNYLLVNVVSGRNDKDPI